MLNEMESGYAASATQGDYSHRFHAGNVGDVWKHVIWLALVRHLHRTHPQLFILDCHAGAGEYDLQPTGEWTAGIGALRQSAVDEPDPLIDEYRRYVDEFGARPTGLRRYPGSPRILERLSRPSDITRCYELDTETAEGLMALPFKPTVERYHGDGLAALHSACTRPASLGAPPPTGQLVGLIDPPWNIKSDWRTIPQMMIECYRAAPQAIIAVWYPIKAYTRVHQLINTLRGAGLPCLVADLITTPLEHRRNRLNGSGVCIVNPPQHLAPQLAAAGARIAAACVTAHGFFEVRLNHSARVTPGESSSAP